MAISQSFIAELQQESATTRKCLERVPADKFGWQPHPKSMTLGRLAGHLVDMTGWAQVTMEMDVFDMNPPGGQMWKGLEPGSTEDLLKAFDEGVEKAKACMAAADDAKWMANWSLANGGNVLMTMPRTAVMRTFVMNHIIHHRGQLTVYLRELNIPIPSIYGPSADEGQMGA